MKSVHAARLYFVEEPAEAVVMLDAGSWRADETELPRTRIGRLELERAVRPVAVAVDEDPQHTLKMASVHDQQPVEALGRTVRTKRSAIAFPAALAPAS